MSSVIPPPNVTALRPERAAKALDVSRRTIDRMIARGELAAIRIGKAVRIPLSELERLVSAAPCAQVIGAPRAVRRRRAPLRIAG